jgi:hypothetical protein
VRERLQLDQIPGPLLEQLPYRDLFAQLGRLASIAAGLDRVVPDPGLG